MATGSDLPVAILQKKRAKKLGKCIEKLPRSGGNASECAGQVSKVDRKVSDAWKALKSEHPRAQKAPKSTKSTQEHNRAPKSTTEHPRAQKAPKSTKMCQKCSESFRKKAWDMPGIASEVCVWTYSVEGASKGPKVLRKSSFCATEYAILDLYIT